MGARSNTRGKSYLLAAVATVELAVESPVGVVEVVMTHGNLWGLQERYKRRRALRFAFLWCSLNSRCALTKSRACTLTAAGR